LKRILVVDDDSSTREVLELAFSFSGFNVITNAGTDNIFYLIDSLKPDIILIDYMLNEVNGGEICNQIKENTRTMNIPVILFSASTEIAASLPDYKFDAFIPKPFDLSAMVDQINGILSANQNLSLTDKDAEAP
jgi:two-component system phosphate regulon response regulator PhoB